jgi:uncharacterized membrane protein YkvA (DUF1232 family)
MHTVESLEPVPDFYQRLRGDMRSWLNGKVGKAHRFADVLCYAPDLVHLLFKLSIDPRIPLQHKAKLAAVLAYFVAPIDAMPEAVLGPSGYLEDMALTAHTLTSLLGARRDILREHWAGDGELVELLDSLVGMADTVFGGGIWKSVLGRLRPN